MPVRQVRRLLASFLDGSIGFGDFDHALAGVLFDLRQTPSVNRERELLAAIQLRIHTFEEGRDKFEVYMAAQHALDSLQTTTTSIASDVDIPNDFHADAYDAATGAPQANASILSGTVGNLVPA